MINFEEAEQIALNALKGSEFIFDGEQIIEKPFGWFFPLRGKTDEPIYGSNGFIVDRQNGHVFQLGSAYPVERDFAAYEAGFKYDIYDLIILTIRDFEMTMENLLELNMTYESSDAEMVPDILGALWKPPDRYSREQIQSALASLPCTFPGQHFYFRYETFLEIDRTGCCTYQLIGHYLENNEPY